MYVLIFMAFRIIRITKRGRLKQGKKNTHQKSARKSEMLEQINKFIEYWWIRYLLATELYVVEKWERVTIRKYNYSRMIHRHPISKFI